MSISKKIEPLSVGTAKSQAPAPEPAGHPLDLAKVQSVYPQVDDRPRVEQARPQSAMAAANDLEFQNDRSRAYEVFAALSGLASCIAYSTIAMLVKNSWLTIGIIMILVLVAMVCAIKSFRDNGSLSPFAIAGVAAATFAFVNIANIVVAHLYIQSLVL